MTALAKYFNQTWYVFLKATRLISYETKIKERGSCQQVNTERNYWNKRAQESDEWYCFQQLQYSYCSYGNNYNAKIYCRYKAWNWTKQRISWSDLAKRINKPTKAVKKLSRLVQQVANSVKSHHTNVNKYWWACRSCCQNVYRMTWVPPSLLQLSMYFLTSWDSNPFVPEGNKPIWPPSWGPDGWLSLFPILSSFVKPDPSRQHGDATSSEIRRIADLSKIVRLHCQC